MNEQNISGEAGGDAMRGGAISDANAERAFGNAGPGPGAGGSPRADGVAGTARQMVSATEHVASGLVGGVTAIAADVVHGIGDVGSEAVLVAKDTANSAIVGVGSVADTAVQTLTGLLVNLVGGVRQIGAAAMRGSNPVQQRGAQSVAPPAPDELAQRPDNIGPRPEDVAIH